MNTYKKLILLMFIPLILTIYLSAQNTQQQDQKGFTRGILKFATTVLPSTSMELVHRPKSALKKPDGDFAEIELFGYLDLELKATNGEGHDIAIYARRPQVGAQAETMHYLVFTKTDEDEWISLGIGGGNTSPEKFDLGDLESINMIRIIYRNQRRLNDPHIDIRDITRAKYRILVDAVEAIH